ncbi:hypothetical protein L210DRAFT_3647599, partial [Boletus edulis BED1]
MCVAETCPNESDQALSITLEMHTWMWGEDGGVGPWMMAELVLPSLTDQTKRTKVRHGMMGRMHSLNSACRCHAVERGSNLYVPDTNNKPPQAALLGSNRGLQDQFSLLSRDLVGASRGPFLVFHRTRQPHPSDLIPPVPHWRLSRALPCASLDSSNPSNRPQPTRCASSQPLLVGHIDRLDDTSSRDLTHHLERLQPTDYLGTSLAPLVDPSLYFTGLVNPIHQTLYLRYPVGASREPFLTTTLPRTYEPLPRRSSRTFNFLTSSLLHGRPILIISLVFVIFRLQLSSQEAQASVANAKDDLLAACHAAEHAATSAASMPRYLAIATNRQFADAINGTMNGAREALILALTCMEAIINFLIGIYRSTFLCFLELVVVGGLGLLISAVQEITSFLQSTLNNIASGIKSDITSVNSAIQSAVNSINKVNLFGNIQAPQFNISSLDSLSNIAIPTDFENALIRLNNSLPTVSSIKNTIQDLVDMPFEAVKADINNTFLGLTFDPVLLPVPAQDAVSFCNSLDTSSIDNLGGDLLQITKIGTVILI